MDESLERQLREALCRREPADGFAERVVDALPRKANSALRWTALAAIAALLVALVTFRFEQQRREHYQRALETQREALFALQLAAERVSLIEARLRQSSVEINIQKEKKEL